MSDWIEWDGSNGGHPEQLNTMVIVRFRDGSVSDSPHSVRWWGGSHVHANWAWGPEDSLGQNAEIVAYRVVENG